VSNDRFILGPVRKNTRTPGKINAKGQYRGPSPVIVPRYDQYEELAPFLSDRTLLPKKPPMRPLDSE
jgi:hypothetical protein